LKSIYVPLTHTLLTSVPENGMMIVAPAVALSALSLNFNVLEAGAEN